jgi:hypothetical protein
LTDDHPQTELRCDYTFWEITDLNRLNLDKLRDPPCYSCIVFPMCKFRAKELNRDYIFAHCVEDLIDNCDILKSFIFLWTGSFPYSTDNPYFVYTARIFELK